MSNRAKLRDALIYSAGLALILALLGLLPEWIRPKSFAFLLKDQSHVSGASFPVERRFRSVASKRSSDLSIQQFADGGLVLINFWATWCPPCIEELPSLEVLNRQLSQAGRSEKLPKIVAISVDENAAEIPKLFKSLDFDPSFSIWHDPKGDLASGLGVRKYPETLLVDAKGTILHKWVGPQDWLSADVLDTIKRFTH